MEKINTDICTGCGACVAICPRKAIKIGEGEEHFYFPQIDENLCVDCGLCLKSCPALKSITVEKFDRKVYAFKNNKTDELLKGSSGSAFYSMANKVIEQGGYVIGATLMEDLVVRHVVIDRFEEIPKLCRSKYVQSFIGPDIYDFLSYNSNKKILFVGTPCQISAIYNYFNEKSLNRNNLYLVDIICRGVPNAWFFKKMIESEEKKYKNKIDNVEFRYKLSKKSSNKRMKISFKNGKSRIISYINNGYYATFYTYKVFRKSCYGCKYASAERLSDITMGDFWGIESLVSSISSRGLSCLIINSVKGEELYNLIKDDSSLNKRFSVQDIINNNYSFSKTLDRNIRSENFYKDLEVLGYEKTIKKYINVPSLSSKFKEYVKILLKY